MAFSTFNSFSNFNSLIPSLINIKTTTFLNITSWYNPDNVTFSSSNLVNTWGDATGHNNLTIVTNPTGSTGITKVANNIQFNNQSYISSTSSFTPLVGGIIYNLNSSNYTGGGEFEQIFSLGTSDLGIRRVFGGVGFNQNDLQFGGNTYVNGTSVQSNNSLTVPTQTGNITIFNQFGGSNSASKINLGNYDPYTQRAATQVSFGHFFIVNPSITLLQQQFIEGYLGYVYKTQSKLPVNHPYYSANNTNVLNITVG